MESVTIRNIPEETNLALNQHDAGADDELRRMLEEAKRSPSTIRAGDLFAAFGRKYGPIVLLPRDQSPVEPAEFE